MLESWGCGLYRSAAYTRVFTVIHISYIQIVDPFSLNVRCFPNVGHVTIL